jgi:hypothetical protein
MSMDAGCYEDPEFKNSMAELKLAYETRKRTTPMTELEAKHILDSTPEGATLIELFREVELFHGIGARE